MKKLVLVVLLMAVTVFVGCGGGGSGSSGGGGNAVTLVGISVAPAAPSISKGATQQFTATGSYSDGSTKNLTTTANWLSSSQAVATINVSGVATAVAPGTTTITASSSGVTGTTTLTVANPLVSIAVTPASAAVSPVAPGNTQQFTAIGTFADASTQDLTATATWQSTSSTIASVSAGLATAVSPGSVTITASMSGVSGTASLTVTNPLVSIVVTPANSSVHQSTKPQFTAIGTYFDKTSNDITATVTWTSSNLSVATISNVAPLQGQVTAIAAGTTTITATLGSISASTTLTVSSATITSILVTPAAAPLSLGLQQQYDALATFSDGTQQDVTNIVTWTSSDTTKVTITTSGLATAVGLTTSPVTITAKASNGVTGFTTVTVNAANLVSITIVYANAPVTSDKIAQGTSRQYSAIGTFNNGSTLNITNQVTWTIVPSGIASVGIHTGVVQAIPSVPLMDNPVTVTATLQSISAAVALDVTNATPTNITVTPISATIPVGATEIFHATASFNDGTSQDVTLNSTWVSSNPSAATVTYPGRLLGVAANPGVTITATFGGVSGTASLVVSTATLTSITVSPANANLAPGSTITFQASGNYSDGSTANLSGLAVWSSSATSVATVNNGVTLGSSAGSANITATYQGVTSNMAGVLVTSSPLTAIAVTPSSPSPTTYVGVGIQFTATGTAGGQSINLTPSAAWASSLSSVATVSNAGSRQGLAIGVGQGTTTITAVFAGITGTATLNVSSATLVSLAITPLNPTISPGTNQQFKATGTFSDGKTVDLTAQVTWASSVASVAPITAAGLASGATAGTTTISASFTQPGQPTVPAPNATLTVN